MVERAFAAIWDELRRLRCQVKHWHRDRDSYGNKCRSCGIYW